ncbi:ATP-binding protein [Microbispora amethystogenes]|uniref:ATP-binding protein n=1 Tax=Microbispora amethystogenes TaxID=1427754 RepID=UPI0033DBD0FB
MCRWHGPTCEDCCFLCDGPRSTTLELLVGELLANAVRHSDSGRRPGGTVTLMVMEDDDGLWIEVADEGSPDLAIHVRPFDPDDDGGRGLWLVDRIASAWGVREAHERRVVWFHLARPPAHVRGPLPGDRAPAG